MRPIVTLVAWSVCLSVCLLSVCHSSEPCQKNETDRDAVWAEDLGGPRWRSTSPMERGNFRVKRLSIVKYRDILPWAMQKRLNPSICCLGCGLRWAVTNVTNAKRYLSLAYFTVRRRWTSDGGRHSKWMIDWLTEGRKHKFNRIRQVALICPHGRAYWCNLTKTTEPSFCCSDAALCQITLTTCFFSNACLYL